LFSSTRRPNVFNSYAAGVTLNPAPAWLALTVNNHLPLDATVVTMPSHGELSVNDDGSFIYVPDTGFVGTDSFEYKAVAASGTLVSDPRDRVLDGATGCRCTGCDQSRVHDR
jgi:hypothetical protein